MSHETTSHQERDIKRKKVCVSNEQLHIRTPLGPPTTLMGTSPPPMLKIYMERPGFCTDH